MRLIELPRTSVFRNTVLLLAFLGIVSAGIFAVVSMRTTDFLVQRVDKSLMMQRDQLSAMSGGDLRRFLDLHARYDRKHRWETVLYDREGRRIAGGDLPKPPEVPANGLPFGFQARGDDHRASYRGVIVPLPSGESLLVSERLGWVSLFGRTLLQASLLAGVVVAAIGLAGAAVVGVDSLGQINAMSRAMQAIMTGDLSRRLPTGRRSGDIDQMAMVVNTMLGEIERLMHEVELVTDGIAHDLRTPLTRLLAALERTSRRARTPQEYAAGLEEAMGEVHRVLDIFNAMLRLAELERGARQAGFEQVQLRPIAESVVDFLQPLAEEKRIALTLSGPNAPLWADPSLIFEALSNLVDNAIKFTPDEGAVNVSVVDDGAPGFVVTDNGCGIPAEERGAVLQRFYRVEKSRHVSGNGLGLSMVAAIGALHGMAIRIEDAAPGARVSLRKTDGDTLPVARARAAEGGFTRPDA